MRSTLPYWMTALFLLLLGGGAGADRIVLAPRGLITVPNSLLAEYAVLEADTRSHFGWINLGLPGDDLGLEIEAEQYRAGGRQRETFSLQYSLTGNGFTDIAPAVSFGIRDLLRRGREGQGLFAAATKSFGLSRAQESIVRDLKVHLGFGTSRMQGPFGGIEARLRLGFTVSAEYIAKQVNVSAAWPVTRFLHLKAYSLDGSFFYGAAILLAR